ncbi:MAG: hypothetical protein HY321_11500 [Armatimonadetes bacterium]|nr:hypothetical protein [Armatimonadota bacterium]
MEVAYRAIPMVAAAVVLLIAAVVFLGIAGGCSTQIRIEPGRGGRIASGLLGTALFLGGLVTWLSIPSPSRRATLGPSASLAPTTTAAPVRSGEPAAGERDGAMAPIYAALRLEGPEADKAVVKSGETITFSYRLVNRAKATLSVPENRRYSRPFHLVGTIQRWVERLGPDSTIPGISEQIIRSGGSYAAGGEIACIQMILGKTTLDPDEAVPLKKGLSTQDYPRGEYRFIVEYKTDEGKVLQQRNVTFKVR